MRYEVYVVIFSGAGKSNNACGKRTTAGKPDMVFTGQDHDEPRRPRNLKRSRLKYDGVDNRQMKAD